MFLSHHRGTVATDVTQGRHQVRVKAEIRVTHVQVKERCKPSSSHRSWGASPAPPASRTVKQPVSVVEAAQSVAEQVSTGVGGVQWVPVRTAVGSVLAPCTPGGRALHPRRKGELFWTADILTPSPCSHARPRTQTLALPSTQEGAGGLRGQVE